MVEQTDTSTHPEVLHYLSDVVRLKEQKFNEHFKKVKWPDEAEILQLPNLIDLQITSAGGTTS